MFPQYNPSYTYDNLDKLIEAFIDKPSESKKLELCLGGYALYRASDGAFWGSIDGSAYHLFVNKEYAEYIKRSIDSYGDWEILYLGCVWLDKDPLENKKEDVK